MAYEEPHVLETSKALAALAVLVFWTAGLGLMDPRLGLGVSLCALSIACTVWLFWKQFQGIRFNDLKTYPWFAIILLFIQIGVPAYICGDKVSENYSVQMDARMEINKSEFVSDTNGKHVRVYAKNKGQLGSGGITALMGGVFSNNLLTEDKTDNIMKEIVRKLELQHTLDLSPQTQPADTTFFDTPESILPETASEFTDGKTIFYLFIVLKYTDERLGKRQHIETRFCGYFTRTLSEWIYCDGDYNKIIIVHD